METEDKKESDKLPEKMKRLEELSRELEELLEKRRANNSLILNSDGLKEIRMLVEDLLGLMRTLTGNVLLTQRQRRSLQGTRARRYGFIDRLADIAAQNMRYAPADWDVSEMQAFVGQIETLRNLESMLVQIERAVLDQLLLTNNEAYRMALLYYGSVRNFANLHDDGAKSLFAMLREFFTSSRISANSIETKAKTKRDVDALLDGKRDGKIVIENETPHTAEGKRVIIDHTHKPEAVNFRETIEGIVCSACNTHNDANARFCKGCGAKLVIND